MKSLKLNINIDVLKIFALITMSLDHIAKYLLDNGGLKECFIGLGRTSFPIFSFLLMLHLAKKDIYKKYIARLFLFGGVALLLIIGGSLVLDSVKVFPLNIMISFLVAVIFLFVADLIKKEEGPKFIKVMMLGFSLLVFAFLSLVLDYGVYGFLFLISMYCYFKSKNKILLGMILLLSCLINIKEYWVVSFFMTGLLFFNQYEEKNKRIISKWWIFYVYYPLHLFLIMVLAYFIK